MQIYKQRNKNHLESPHSVKITINTLGCDWVVIGFTYTGYNIQQIVQVLLQHALFTVCTRHRMSIYRCSRTGFNAEESEMSKTDISSQEQNLEACISQYLEDNLMKVILRKKKKKGKERACLAWPVGMRRASQWFQRIDLSNRNEEAPTGQSKEYVLTSGGGSWAASVVAHGRGRGGRAACLPPHPKRP